MANPKKGQVEEPINKEGEENMDDIQEGAVIQPRARTASNPTETVAIYGYFSEDSAKQASLEMKVNNAGNDGHYFTVMEAGKAQKESGFSHIVRHWRYLYPKPKRVAENPSMTIQRIPFAGTKEEGKLEMLKIKVANENPDMHLSLEPSTDKEKEEGFNWIIRERVYVKID